MPDEFSVAVATRKAPGHLASTSVSIIALRKSRASLSRDEVDEYAFVVVLQVGQIVGKVGEVVAGADLQVFAEITIDRCQRAAPALTDVREVEHSHLG